ncbi:MAG: Gfo/Idh/MocA family oxidoreductase [Acidobacteria bacterium]|nr:Gfo/Idh/MocA family oxidoreductase [Acidobacteriota bacterium]
MNRRDFVRATATTALSYQRIVGANDRVRMGFIGLGNRGDQVLDAFLEHGDNEVAAVCDLRDDYMDFAHKKSRANPAHFRDYRKLLELKTVDAVAIATPDHWHALMCVDACNAGKDVYVEKPLSLTVVEGRKMVEAARRNNRVTQVGVHRRSAPFCREAAEIIRTGGLGHVTMAASYNIRNEYPNGIGNPADSAPPPGVDWDLWLGPAPKVAFNPNRAFYRFRWFWNYSGGQVTNYGVHYLDMIQWSLGKDAPLSVTAIGGKYAVQDNREAPDTAEVLWEYPGGTIARFSQYSANGAPSNARNSEIEFRGTLGTLYLMAGAYELVPERINEAEVFARTPLDRQTERAQRSGAKASVQPRSLKGSADTAFHARNFLDCVKSRTACNCDIETGHRSTTAALIGNIAMRLKTHLQWDPVRERFTNSEAANQHLHYQYRSPWKIS